VVAIDTLSYARRLEQAGVPRAQAEAHAEAVHALVREEVATKADVETVKRDLQRDLQEVEARLKSEIRELDLRLGGKIDGVETRLDAKIDQLESRIAVKLGGMLAPAVALTVALVKLL
jgi:hypothetical protein